MITVEEFTARTEQIAGRQAKAKEHQEKQVKELQALCILAGWTCSVSGGHVWLGKDGNTVIEGQVLDELVGPAPDDGPFGFLRGFGVSVPAEVPAGVAPVHIDRPAFNLLSELAETLSDYLDSLA